MSVSGFDPSCVKQEVYDTLDSDHVLRKYEEEHKDDPKEEKLKRAYFRVNNARYQVVGYQQVIKYGSDIEGGLERTFANGQVLKAKQNP